MKRAPHVYCEGSGTGAPEVGDGGTSAAGGAAGGEGAEGRGAISSLEADHGALTSLTSR